MQTSQSAQSPCDHAPKKVSFAEGGSSANTLGLLLLWMLFVLLLFCFGFLSGPFKKKNVWLNWWKFVLETINDSWKYRSTETLDKNKKTLILVFRCWHYKTNGQSLWKSFEAMNEMFISIVFVFKLSLSICNVVLSSFYSKLQFLLVALHHRRSFLYESAFEANVFLSPKLPVSSPGDKMPLDYQLSTIKEFYGGPLLTM